MSHANHPPSGEWKIDPEQEQRMRAGDATLEWLCQQPSTFFRPYAGKWIAANDCQIIASAESHEALLQQLHSAGTGLESIIIHRVERPGWTIYSCNSASRG